MYNSLQTLLVSISLQIFRTKAINSPAFSGERVGPVQIFHPRAQLTNTALDQPFVLLLLPQI